MCKIYFRALKSFSKGGFSTMNPPNSNKILLSVPLGSFERTIHGGSPSIRRRLSISIPSTSSIGTVLSMITASGCCSNLRRWKRAFLFLTVLTECRSRLKRAIRIPVDLSSLSRTRMGGVPFKVEFYRSYMTIDNVSQCSVILYA
jgi:hypothetical protein